MTSDYFKDLQKWYENNPEILEESRKTNTYNKRHPRRHRKSQKRYRNNEQNIHKIIARQTVQKAVRQGKLESPTTLICSMCDKLAAHYHHEDYGQPLKVTPLCTACHGKTRENLT